MKNSLQKTILNLLISALITTCGTNELKRDKQELPKEKKIQQTKDEEKTVPTNKDPEIVPAHFFQPDFIEQKKEIENITEQTQDQYNEILEGKSTASGGRTRPPTRSRWTIA